VSNVFRYEARKPFYLQEWLNVRRKSQVWLANELGVGKDTISRWISQPWRVNWDALSAIADALKLDSPGMLFIHPSKVGRPPSPEQVRELRQAAETILKNTT
jgi:hypothetical protein